MTDDHQQFERRAGLSLLLASPLIIFATTFVSLYVTYRVTRSFAPGLLGEVADRPAAFAALIALVALPMHALLLLGHTWSALKALLTGAELPTPPIRTGWRRFGSYLVGVLPDVAAALIVFLAIAAPSTASLTPLLTVTIVGPIALTWSLRGLGALIRRGWRRWTNRGYQPKHPMPADSAAEHKGPLEAARDQGNLADQVTSLRTELARTDAPAEPPHGQGRSSPRR